MDRILRGAGGTLTVTLYDSAGTPADAGAGNGTAAITDTAGVAIAGSPFAAVHGAANSGQYTVTIPASLTVLDTYSVAWTFPDASTRATAFDLVGGFLFTIADLRGFDLAGLTSMLSVPLTWNDIVVGVLNVQTVATRRFTPREINFLATIAALLAGIVEKGRLQREQERQLGELQALDEARAELLSVVTHELRTPLSVVRAYVDLLADAAGGQSDAPARASSEDWRNAAIDQIGRLDRLVDSILVSVRGEGLGVLARSPFDLGRTMDETVELLRPLLRNHQLRWEPSEDRLIALGDEGRFRQVLELLLENEAKYAPRNWGVSIGAWRQAGEIRVYTTDDGPGVPAEDWESVFEAFVRATGRRGRGSGIGLYAARRLMMAMGGRIWIEGNGFGGSRSVAALPAVAPD